MKITKTNVYKNKNKNTISKIKYRTKKRQNVNKNVKKYSKMSGGSFIPVAKKDTEITKDIKFIENIYKKFNKEKNNSISIDNISINAIYEGIKSKLTPNENEKFNNIIDKYSPNNRQITSKDFLVNLKFDKFSAPDLVNINAILNDKNNSLRILKEIIANNKSIKEYLNLVKFNIDFLTMRDIYEKLYLTKDDLFNKLFLEQFKIKYIKDDSLQYGRFINTFNTLETQETPTKAPAAPSTEVTELPITEVQLIVSETPVNANTVETSTEVTELPTIVSEIPVNANTVETPTKSIEVPTIVSETPEEATTLTKEIQPPRDRTSTLTTLTTLTTPRHAARPATTLEELDRELTSSLAARPVTRPVTSPATRPETVARPRPTARPETVARPRPATRPAEATTLAELTREGTSRLAARPVTIPATLTTLTTPRPAARRDKETTLAELTREGTSTLTTPITEAIPAAIPATRPEQEVKRYCYI